VIRNIHGMWYNKAKPKSILIKHNKEYYEIMKSTLSYSMNVWHAISCTLRDAEEQQKIDL